MIWSWSDRDVIGGVEEIFQIAFIRALVLLPPASVVSEAKMREICFVVKVWMRVDELSPCCVDGWRVSDWRRWKKGQAFIEHFVWKDLNWIDWRLADWCCHLELDKEKNRKRIKEEETVLWWKGKEEFERKLLSSSTFAHSLSASIGHQHGSSEFG